MWQYNETHPDDPVHLGDRIVAVNGTTISGVANLVDTVKAADPDMIVTVERESRIDPKLSSKPKVTSVAGTSTTTEDLKVLAAKCCKTNCVCHTVPQKGVDSERYAVDRHAIYGG